MEHSNYKHSALSSQLGSSGYAGASTRALVDQTRLVYSLTFVSILFELFAIGITASIFYSLLEQNVLKAWVFSASYILLSHVWIVIRFWAKNPLSENIDEWSRKYTLNSIFSGLVWGAASVLVLLYGSLNEQLIISLVITGVITAAFACKFSILGAFAGFMVPAILPSLLWSVHRFENFHIIMSVSSVVLMTLLLLAAAQIRKNLEKFYRIRHENTGLMKNLANAKEQSESGKAEAIKLNKVLQDGIKEREEAQNKIKASEEELSSILNNIRDVVFRVDDKGIFTWASTSIFDLLGYEVKEAIGHNMSFLFYSNSGYVKLLRSLENYKGLLSNHTAKFKSKDERVIWVSVNTHYIYDENEVVSGIEGTIRDIHDYKISQDALFMEKGRAQVTLEAIGDGVITTDVNANIEYFNPAAEKFTGWSQDDAKGKLVELVLNLVDENTKEPLSVSPVAKCLQDGVGGVLNESAILVHRHEDTEFSVEVTTAPIMDTEGTINGVVLVFHDVTKLRSLARQMSYQARHDPLTGLINRREFETQLTGMLLTAQQENKRHCICYLDLDQFKIVNDTCGHTAGDELLKGVTSELDSNLREADTLARLGGDEFAVLLKGCPLEKAKDIAETLRAAVEQYRFNWDGKEFSVGASIGVVAITEGSGELTDILSAADSAMYVAKEGGRNRVHVFDEADTAIAQRHGEMQWKQRIQNALEQDRFNLYYQPIVLINNDDNSQIDGEILLRMIDEDGSIITPFKFMPSAERYHLMPSVDRWVIKNSFSFLRSRMKKGLRVPVCSVNLSGQSLSDEKLLDFILDHIYEGGEIPPELLCFEITETAVVANIDRAMHIITELRGIGVKFALDDFGSGMSSFGYLKNLPVDYLKIDGQFILNLKDDSKDRSVVKAINEIGHVMGIKTIAEHVEDDETLELLKMLNVDYAQGYGLGKPAPIDDFDFDSSAYKVSGL